MDVQPVSELMREAAPAGRPLLSGFLIDGQPLMSSSCPEPTSAPPPADDGGFVWDVYAVAEDVGCAMWDITGTGCGLVRLSAPLVQGTDGTDDSEVEDIGDIDDSSDSSSGSCRPGAIGRPRPGARRRRADSSSDEDWEADRGAGWVNALD